MEYTEHVIKAITELKKLQATEFIFENNNKSLIDKDVQLVISGGGFTGFYGVGIGHIINNYMNTQKIKGIIGTSAGTLCAVYIACNISVLDWYETSQIINSEVKKGYTLLEAMYYVNNKVLPDNAHILCNQFNVEIVATKVTLFGLEKKIFRYFTSREELLQCICASCCLPYLINWKFPYSIKINGEYYIDGCLIDNVPIKKKCLYDQIVIKNYNIPYPFMYRFSPSDKNIHKIMIQGAEDFIEFINNPKEYRKPKIIKLHDKDKKNKIINNKKAIFNTILINSIFLYISIYGIKLY